MLPLLTLLSACSPKGPWAPPEPEPTGTPQAALPRRWEGPRLVGSVSVLAVGDLLMHGMVQKSAGNADIKGPDGASTNQGGFPVLWEHIRPRIEAADLAFANLETPVAPDHNLGTRPFVFNVPAIFLDAVKVSGFDVLSFANNHVYDQGRPGFVETLDRLDGSGLTYLGAGRTCAGARAFKLVEREGVKIAWIGSSKVYNDNLNTTPEEACSFELDEALALQEAQAARAAGADLVVMSIHWGAEYKTAPAQETIDLAHRLLEGGVDVILGHHPHVLQPVEVLQTADGRTALVAYSLGNFVSNQSAWYIFGTHEPRHGDTRDGLALTFDVVKKDYGPGPDGQPQIRTSLANVVGFPLWTDNLPGPVIRTIDVDRALAEAQAALAAATDPKEVMALKSRIELLTVRRAEVQGIVGERFLPAI